MPKGPSCWPIVFARKFGVACHIIFLNEERSEILWNSGTKLQYRERKYERVGRSIQMNLLLPLNKLLLGRPPKTTGSQNYSSLEPASRAPFVTIQGGHCADCSL